MQCNCKEILIVDDNPYNIMALKTLLCKHNLKIDEANDGFECLSKLNNYLQNNGDCSSNPKC